MISFELDDKHDVKKFFSALDTILLAESLGGVESLICHPGKSDLMFLCPFGHGYPLFS